MLRSAPWIFLCHTVLPFDLGLVSSFGLCFNPLPQLVTIFLMTFMCFLNNIVVPVPYNNNIFISVVTIKASKKMYTVCSMDEENVSSFLCNIVKQLAYFKLTYLHCCFQEISFISYKCLSSVNIFKLINTIVQH